MSTSDSTALRASSSPPPPIAPQEPWLAPIAGYSDLPFRVLCRELGASAACTEMISAKGLVFQSQSTQRLLVSTPEDAPLVVQLFGAEPTYLQQAVQTLRGQGFAWFDLNAGCPVKKVVRTGAGAALLREPGLLEEILGLMLEAAGPGRVGVKIRSGWAHGEDGHLAAAERLRSLPLGWITLHPRSAKQGFAGRADWRLLRELKQVVPFPVIGSGDLLTAGNGLACLQSTGIDGVMFARGALRDPALFSRFKAASAGGARLEPARGCRYGERLRIARRHVVLSRDLTPDREAFLKMRSVIPKYLRAFQKAKELRGRILRCGSWEEILGLLDRLEREVPSESTAEPPPG